MIHSLAGGKIKDIEIADLVQVKNLAGSGELFWCRMPFFMLKEGDKCLVAAGYKNIECEVAKIKKNVSSNTFPIKFRNLKEIIKKL